MSGTEGRDTARDAVANGLGAGLGFLLSGPAGGMAGAAAGPVVVDALLAAGGDQLARLLSTGERGRLEVTLRLAATEIRRRWENDERPRSDLFERSFQDARELLDGTLTKARNLYQAAKIPHIAHFMVDVLFDEDADVEASFHLLNLAERFSYQQYVMLALFDRRHSKRQLGSASYGHHPRSETLELMLPLADLFDSGMLQEEDSDELIAVGQLASRYDGTSISMSAPDKIRLALAGQRLADRLALHRVPPERIDDLAERLGTA